MWVGLRHTIMKQNNTSKLDVIESQIGFIPIAAERTEFDRKQLGKVLENHLHYIEKGGIAQLDCFQGR